MSLEVTDSYIDAFGNIAFNGLVVKIDLVFYCRCFVKHG
jgi:hypothetical protein